MKLIVFFFCSVLPQSLIFFSSSLPLFSFWGPSGKAWLHAWKWLVWALSLSWCSLLPCAKPAQARTFCEKWNKWKKQRTNLWLSCGFNWHCVIHLLSSVCVVFFFACVRVSMPAPACMGVYILYSAYMHSFTFALHLRLVKKQTNKKQTAATLNDNSHLQTVSVVLLISASEIITIYDSCRHCLCVGVWWGRKCLRFRGKMAAY